MHPTLLGALVEVTALLCVTSVIHRLIVHKEVKGGFGSSKLSSDDQVQKPEDAGRSEVVSEPGQRRYGASGQAGGLKKGPDGRDLP